jgi:hypothetical protein
MAEAILANWRSIEWELLMTFPFDSPETSALRAKAEFLRSEYEDLVDRARAEGKPEPPPFPTEAGPPPA